MIFQRKGMMVGESKSLVYSIKKAREQLNFAIEDIINGIFASLKIDGCGD